MSSQKNVLWRNWSQRQYYIIILPSPTPSHLRLTEQIDIYFNYFNPHQISEMYNVTEIKTQSTSSYMLFSY